MKGSNDRGRKSHRASPKRQSLLFCSLHHLWEQAAVAIPHTNALPSPLSKWQPPTKWQRPGKWCDW